MIKNNIRKIIKYLILAIISSLFYCVNLSAKTAGNYIGVDFVKTNLSLAMEVIFNDKYKDNIYNTEKLKHLEGNPEGANSYGFKYNYAINYKGLFISPGIFYEANNAKTYFNRSSTEAEARRNFYGNAYAKIAQRYGAKIDIGIDITDSFSVYGTIGKAMNHYVDYSSVYGERYDTGFTGEHWAITRGKKSAPLYGGGFRVKLFEHWLLNGEYNYSRFTNKTNARKDYGDYSYQGQTYQIAKRIDFNNYLHIFKIGINYNF